MKIRYLGLLYIMIILAFMAIQGCGQQSSVDSDDLAAFNQLALDSGAEVITLEKAEDLNMYLYKNKTTDEIKSCWQLVVDYIHNTNSDEQSVMDYAVEFNKGGFDVSIKDNDTWEFLGR